MSKYAQDTSVSVERSLSEIRAIVQRYGARSFVHAEQDDKAMIMFEASGRRVRFALTLPNRDDRKFWYTPTQHRKRTDKQAYAEWEQACRQRWRALSLVIKAKLEAVEAGITTFEEEFLAHIVLPSGESAGSWLIPQIAAAYESREMPPLLPSGRP